MKGLLARRPSPAMVVALIALVLALTGTAWAALGKNSVGAKQLKKGAVTTAKLKKEAVTAGKVKKHSLTGANLNLAKLGTVPSATNATNAVNATTATNAGTASALTPLEPVHYVGTPGQPPFIEGENAPSSPFEGTDASLRNVGFYKDHEGIVHLEGVAGAGPGEPGPVIFSLPAGYRPAPKTVLTFPNVEGEQIIAVVGSGVRAEGRDYSGDVVLITPGSDNAASLNGITFRAEG